ncbi:MAG: MEKHLA domain-containing protein, partial [Synechococcus sp. MED-G135]
MQAVAEQHAPWLSPDSRAWAARIRRSHSHAFRRPLLANRHNCSPNARVSCQELFAAPWPVLAHNDSSDPALVYANAAALKLWQRRWAQMVG